MGKKPDHTYTFKMFAGVDGTRIATPAELAQTLRALADDLDQGTAGNPNRPIIMTDSTTIAGNVANAAGVHVGSWSIQQ